MGLYLAVFDGDEEIEGVEVGSYSDFGCFRETVTAALEAGRPGSRFPTLVVHSDCDGAWSSDDAARLREELVEIADGLRRLPPRMPEAGSWQSDIAKSLGLAPTNLYESFFDVDGELLVERLSELAQIADARRKEILFQ